MFGWEGAKALFLGEFPSWQDEAGEGQGAGPGGQRQWIQPWLVIRPPPPTHPSSDLGVGKDPPQPLRSIPGCFGAMGQREMLNPRQPASLASHCREPVVDLAELPARESLGHPAGSRFLAAPHPKTPPRPRCLSPGSPFIPRRWACASTPGAQGGLGPCPARLELKHHPSLQRQHVIPGRSVQLLREIPWELN